MANILYDNCFNTSYHTFVKEVKEENGLYWHLLDETIFFAESGGMPSDEGYINQIPVIALKKVGNQVWHLLSKKLEGKVELAIDFHLRFHHAQNHTAQHLISGIVESVYGCKTLSHHVHEDHCDIEFNREILNERQINELKIILNGLIRDDLPVKIFYPTQKEISYLTTKDVSDFDEVRMVSIGKISVDPCACIHVPSLRYIQAISILGVERTTKGMKLHYVCGDQLLNSYDLHYQELSKTGVLLAQPIEFVEFGVLKLLQEVKNLSADNQLLKQRYINTILDTLPTEGNVYYKFENIDLKSFGLACKTFKNEHHGNFIFTCVNDEHVQIFISCENSKAIFDDLSKVYHLKGGGNAKSAQGGGIYQDCLETDVLKILSLNK